MENVEVEKNITQTIEKTNRFISGEFLTLAGLFVSCFLFLHTEIKSIDSRIENRIQSQEQEHNARMIAQEQRADKLYEMFIELIKEKNNKT